jgi:ABC-type cobalamin/Fe3+-siderophores transport system ATPase subunit
MSPTRLQLLQYEYRLSEDENDKIFHARIIPENYTATNLNSKPVAVIVAGQTASGKSTLIGSSQDELQYEGSAVEICSDNMRPYHPDYKKSVKQYPDISTYIVYERIKNRGGDYENFVRDMNAEDLFNRRRLKR